MNNELKDKKKKSLVLKMAEIFFVVYMITDYLFMKDKDALKYTYIAFILFAGFTGLYILERKRMYFGKAFMLAYLSCAWMLASVMWAENKYYAMIQVKTMWQLFVLFFLIYNLFYENRDAYKIYVKAMYIAGIFFVIYTVYSYGVSELIKMVYSDTTHRLGAEFSQKNVYGMNHATTALIAFYYMVRNKKYKLFNFVVLCASFICTMSSGSKKALLIVVIGVLYLIYKSYGIRQFYKVIGLTLFAGILFYMAIHLPMFEMLRRRFEGSINALLGKSGGDSSTVTRMSFIETGWRLFKDKILIGYGADNFKYVSGVGVYSHNNFIEILVNFGIIGFTMFYSMYVVAFRNMRKEQTYEGKLLVVIFLVKTALELAGINYFTKKTWIMFAFMLLPVNRFAKMKEKKTFDNEILLSKGAE